MIKQVGAIDRKTGKYVFPENANKNNNYICPDVKCNEKVILKLKTNRKSHFSHYTNYGRCTSTILKQKGALNKFNNYILPNNAHKDDEYKCPDCNNIIKFIESTTINCHFTHISSNDCKIYNNSPESLYHKNAKFLLKDLLRNKTITIIRDCSDCGNNKYTHNIPIFNINTKISIEYLFDYKGSKKKADVAYLHTNIQYIFEIFHTHKTNSKNRPEPWFEFDTETLLNTSYIDTKIELKCIRRYTCDMCREKKINDENIRKKERFYKSINYNNISEYKFSFNFIDPYRIDWKTISLSKNPAAIHLLEQNKDKINWGILSSNPVAIKLLEQNPDKIYWYNLSKNPAAIHLLEQNLDKVNWRYLSENPSAIPILEKNLDKIVWSELSKNPSATSILEQNLDKIDWYYLSDNPSAIHLLEKNLDKIDWDILSFNQAAIPILEKNLDKINWEWLSRNPSAIPILEKNVDKIDWFFLLKNPSAIHLLEKNIDKIDWFFLLKNPSAIHLLEKNIDKIDWEEFEWEENIQFLDENYCDELYDNWIYNTWKNYYQIDTKDFNIFDNTHTINIKTTYKFTYLLLNKFPNFRHQLITDFIKNKYITSIIVLTNNLYKNTIDWKKLSSDINIHLLSNNILEKCIDKIDRKLLSSNPNIYKINLNFLWDKIDWKQLSSNPNIYKINFNYLCMNLDKFDYDILNTNINIHLLDNIFEDIYVNCNSVYKILRGLIHINKYINFLDYHSLDNIILEKNLDKIDWKQLSSNPNIYKINNHFLYKYLYKIDWKLLLFNSNIHLLNDSILEKCIDKIDSKLLSSDINIHLLSNNILEKCTSKIDWKQLSSNPNIYKINHDYLCMNLDKFDYDILNTNINIHLLDNIFECINNDDINNVYKILRGFNNINYQYIHLLNNNILEKCISKIDWKQLSSNPNIHIVTNYNKYMYNIDWDLLRENRDLYYIVGDENNTIIIKTSNYIKNICNI